MSAVKDGGAAFPTYNALSHCDEGGMSLRDYFAAKAMQGFAADPQAAWKGGITEMAQRAYEWADAMLRAREVTP